MESVGFGRARGGVKEGLVQLGQAFCFNRHPELTHTLRAEPEFSSTNTVGTDHSTLLKVAQPPMHSLDKIQILDARSQIDPHLVTVHRPNLPKGGPVSFRPRR